MEGGELGGVAFELKREPVEFGPGFPSRVDEDSENNEGRDLDAVNGAGEGLWTDESELVDDAGEDPLEMGVP